MEPTESPSSSRPSTRRPADGREEKRLLAALRRSEAEGDERRAAERLVETTWRRTYAALFRLTGGDGELAADLTQDAYRKAWDALPQFDGRARFSTWLYRIAYTTFLNHARRPRRVVPLSERVADDPEAEAPPRDAGLPDPGPLPDEALGAARDRDRLRRAVLALPEDLRFTVTARYWGELTAREIARQEGVGAAAVRKRLRKALPLLAAALENDPEVEA